MGEVIDLTGQKFGRLTVIQRYYGEEHANDKRHTYYECLCECGNTIIVRTDLLKNGNTKSCGCLRSEVARETSGEDYREEQFKRKYYDLPGDLSHSDKKSPYNRLYRIWINMKQRCYNPKNKSYKYYGAKGVRVCDSWKNSYENFFNDMYPTYKIHVVFHSEHDTTLDRIDPYKDYCPENCRWSTYKVQNNNKRTKPKKKRRKNFGYSASSNI